MNSPSHPTAEALLIFMGVAVYGVTAIISAFIVFPGVATLIIAFSALVAAAVVVAIFMSRYLNDE